MISLGDLAVFGGMCLCFAYMANEVRETWDFWREGRRFEAAVSTVMLVGATALLTAFFASLVIQRIAGAA